MKVIVEIDGVRHKMAKNNVNNVKDTCNLCSLSKLCNNKIGCPCRGALDYFILER